MLVEVIGIDRLYVNDLAPEGTDSEIAGPVGTTVRYLGAMEYRSVDIPAVHEFLIQVTAGVAANVIAAWLIGRFRGRSEKLTINRRQVDLDDEGQVRRIVEEEITRER